MLSHSPKWVFPLPLKPPTPPLLLPTPPLLALPHAWLRKQKQSDRNIIFAICRPLSLSASIFVFSAFCPVAMGEVSLLLPNDDKPSTCAWDSKPCLLKDITMMTMTSLGPAPLGSPSVLNKPYQHTFPSVSWPHIVLLLPFFPALVHSTNSCVVYRHPASHFTSQPVQIGFCPALSALASMLPDLMLKFLPLSYLTAQQCVIW